MAWRSHGSTNEELVDKLFENGMISDRIIADVRVHLSNDLNAQVFLGA